MAATASKGWVKPVTDFAPLVVFFAAFYLYDLFVATAAIMVATLLSLILAYAVEKRVAVMPLVTAVVIGIFGGLTLWLNDETFVKMKPTIVQIIFAAVLLGGLAFKKPLLKPLMGSAWPMDDAGWNKLSLRFGLFFVVMALINEAVWRTQSTEFWVNFKVFGIMVLTLIFAASQTPLMQRHALPEEGGEET